jgi:hypothetical protein
MFSVCSLIRKKLFPPKNGPVPGPVIGCNRFGQWVEKDASQFFPGDSYREGEHAFMHCVIVYAQSNRSPKSGSETDGRLFTQLYDTSIVMSF